MRLLSGQDVASLMNAEELLAAVEDGFQRLSEGHVQAPPRSQVSTDQGLLIAMPGHSPTLDICVKLVTVFHGNRAAVPSHQALICLFDPSTGSPVAILDGTHVTTMRTAAGAAIATRLLSRLDARVLTIVGAGPQGRGHLELLPRVRRFAEILIVSRQRERAESLAAAHPAARAVNGVEDAVRRSDVVCLCTSATTPVVQEAWLQPGAHLTSVGFAPPGGELDPLIAARHRLFVETRLAFQPPPVGCAELAGLEPASAIELGELIAGARHAPWAADTITVYKSMGHAVEDLVTADLVHRAAQVSNVGTLVEL